MMSLETTTPVKGAGFSEEALREISWSKGEPDWVMERRLEAWRLYEQTPMPSRQEEEWRRTDLSALDLAAVRAYAEPEGRANRLEDLPPALRSEMRNGEPSGGLLVQRNSANIYHCLDEALAARGVLLADLDRAVKEHPELVKGHLLAKSSPKAGRFAALHAAFRSGGAFVYVPRNVEVQLPIHLFTWVDAPALGVMPHTLVVVEPGASLVLVDEFASPETRGPLLANRVADLVVGEGARLQYVGLQRWGNTVFNFETQRAEVGRDAQFVSLSVVLGSRLTKSWIDAHLSGRGANVQMLGIAFAEGKQRFHQHTVQDHLAPNGTSDLLFKTALVGEARAEFSGLIRVHPEAQKTDAYQANRNLLLSDRARADSMPKLEIENNDVRCTHGATVGPIDPEQLFYLMARGLPKAVAERMVVEGFLEPVLERIPLPAVQERVRRAVDAKLSVTAN